MVDQGASCGRGPIIMCKYLDSGLLSAFSVHWVCIDLDFPTWGNCVKLSSGLCGRKEKPVSPHSPLVSIE